MLTNYHTLSYIVSSIRKRLVGSVIVEAFSQEKEELVLRFRGVDDVLIISCDRVVNTLFWHSRFARARANSVNVLHSALEKPVTDVQMHSVDRVIQFRLESGERLDAMFFGPKANVVLVDELGIILEAFRDAKTMVGTKAAYRSGEIVYDFNGLRRRLAQPQLATITALMKEEFPTLGTTLIKEVLHRAAVPHGIGAMSLTETHLREIQIALSSLLADLAKPGSRVYLETHPAGHSTYFSLVPLRHLATATEHRFDDVHEAIRFYLSQLHLQGSVDEQKKALVGKLRQKIAKARRTIEAVEADVLTSARAEEYQRFGELLLANLQHLKKGDERFVVCEMEIPMATEATPVQNAQRYFEKAKRSRVARQQASVRLKELRATIAPAEQLLTALDAVTTKAELKQFMTTHKEELEELGVYEKKPERAQLPFRIFTVEGGFEVWAGKSSKNNDQLTLKYAKPNDLWFHARGAAGSHVVLKVNTGKGEPGKKAKEQAASIAAYYSKMKNARMVPVAMTQKKYVRKPKSAAAGSVVVEREQVIFAEPALPREQRHEDTGA